MNWCRLFWLSYIALVSPAAGTEGMNDPQVTELVSPTGPGSAQPHLTSSQDGVFLSWLEPQGGGHSLRFSRWDGTRWSPATTIVNSKSLFVNWADFPSLLAQADGGLVAHWLEKGGEGPYEYNALISRSTDGGKTWSHPISPHRDVTLNEHGFVSLLDRGPGRFAAVWLDGRNFKKEDSQGSDLSNEMSLMFAEFADGEFRPEIVLDRRVCDCCQTAAAVTPGGLFAAYRDRGEDEVRDISFVRYGQDRWSEPRTLHADGWEIPACPVNGPQVAAKGENLVIAWFTFAGQKGRVKAVFSSDAGETFGPPVSIDDGNPLGRADVEWLGDGSALVTWLEQTGAKTAEVRARQINPEGSPAPSFLVARSTPGRASGFPRLTRQGDYLFVAWTDASADLSRVRVAKVAPR
jgi:hypothetical protein